MLEKCTNSKINIPVCQIRVTAIDRYITKNILRIPKFKSPFKCSISFSLFISKQLLINRENYTEYKSTTRINFLIILRISRTNYGEESIRKLHISTYYSNEILHTQSGKLETEKTWQI